jgi:YgiT-type zinc finger domain-containing protein
MKCPVCHVTMKEIQKGEADLRIKGELYLVRNITYDECPICGEKVFSPKVSQWIYGKVKGGDYKKEQVTLPVLDGTYG